MYESSVRSATAGTGRTLLAIVAILSLLLSAFAIARPGIAAASSHHCPGGGEGAPPGAINQTEGSIDEDGVLIEWSGDPGTVTITSNNETDATVVFCAKGGDDFADGSQSSGEVTVTLMPGETATFSFGTGISYFVLYSITVEEPEEDETVTLIKQIVGDTTDTFDLLINGTVELAGAGDGNSTGAVVTAEGSVTVGEAAAGDASLDDYTTTIVCLLGAEEIVNVSATSTEFTLGDNEDVVCTITNTLIDEEPGNGFLEIDKILCEGSGDPTFEIIAEEVEPQSLRTQQASECPTTDATFDLVPAGSTEAIDTVTTVGGTITFDVPAGDYFLIETESGAQSEVFTVGEGLLTIVLVTNFEEAPAEEGNLKVVKFLCEGEGPESGVRFELLDGDATIPDPDNCELSEATFTLNDPESETTFTTVDGVLWLDNVPVGTHTLFEIAPNQGSIEFTITEAGAWVTIFVFNFEGEQPAELGSITLQKDFEEGECPVCETRTPGYWFNRGGGGGVDLANELLPGLNVTFPIGEEGSTTFDSVQAVHDYLDWDRAGGDGETGLSGTAQLLRHYLALLLNVTVTDCPWGDIMFGELSVLGWLDAAEAVLLEGGEDESIKDALDAINNATHGDGTLECPESVTGSLAGFTFELWLGDELLDSMTTDDSGSVTFADLELGVEYTIVEISPDGLDCTILSVSNDGAVLNEDGTVSVTLTEENPDITITVVNECEGEQEEELGSVLIAKVDESGALLGGATFEIDGTAFADTDADGLVCVDGLDLGSSVTIEETIAPDGFIGDDESQTIDVTSTMDCEDRLDGATVVDADAEFVNVAEEVEEEVGFLEIDKILCPGAGDTTFEVIATVGPTDVMAQSAHECGVMDATFIVTEVGAETALDEVTTVGGTITFELPAGDYVLTEEETGAVSGTITVVDGVVTIVLVTNFEGEGEQPVETGNLKVVKWFCEDDEADVRFEVLDGDAAIPNPADCELGEATFTLNDPESETTFTTEGGVLWLTGVPIGTTHTVFEVAPNEGSVEFTIDEADAWVTVFVFNFEGGEGLAPEEETPTTRGGELPSQGGPGQGTLPNTATAPAPTTSVPAALLAMVMLTGLGAAGYAMQAEARRRR